MSAQTNREEHGLARYKNMVKGLLIFVLILGLSEFITAVTPAVTLVSPADNNNSVDLTGTMTIKCNATDTDGDLANITLYHNMDGTWQASGTETLSGSSGSSTFTRNLSDFIGSNKFKDTRITWNCLAYDSTGNSDLGDSNYTFSGWDLGSYNKSLLYPAYLGATDNDTEQELPNNQANDGFIDMGGNVLLMHMNEASGAIVDTSGQGNNGTYNGALYYQSGKLNTAIGFDGSNDYVDCGNDSSLRITGNMTLEAWIKPMTFPPWMAIVSSGDTSTDKGYAYLFGIDASGHLMFGANRGADGYKISDDTLTTGIFSHVAAVFNPSADLVFFYINGVDTGSSGITDNPVSNSICPITIGARIDDGCGNLIWFFNGTIDEVAIWNRILSADEILDIYNRQKGKYIGQANYESKAFDAGTISLWKNLTWDEAVPYGEELPDNKAVDAVSGGANMTGNVLLMHMNEQSGTIVDYSGEGNNGTNNGATYGAGGKFDTALEFDGKDDYVEVSGSSDFQFSGDLAIEIWVKAKSFPISGEVIISNSNDYINLLNGFSLYPDNGGTMVYVRSGSGVVFKENYIMNTNVWYHIVVTRAGTGSNNVKLYINGQVRNQTTNTDVWGGTNILRIGNVRHSDGSSYYHWDGIIDEVAIYNHSLSAEEILNHYKRGASRLNISARSCNDPACSGETYSVQCENASFCNLSSLSNNRYFQYKVNFETDDANYTPELITNSVTVNYETYSIESVNCNTGAEQNEFDAAESVCVSGTADSDGSDIWVCGNRTWGGGENLTDIGCVKNATSVAGTFSKLNLGIKNIGYYGLVLDVCQDGIYDSGSDALDDADISDTAGFYIYPEAATLVLILSGLSLVYGYARLRKS